MREYKMLIDGQWVESKSGKRFPVHNPATGEVLATVPDGDAGDASAAIEAAHRAFAGWSRMPAHERSAILRRIYELIKAKAEDLAQILSQEQGKPLAEARAEVASGAEYVAWYAEEARRVYGETIPGMNAQQRLWVIRQPVGVVAAITPWNFPSSMITRKVAPALAAGCTVVIKPAEQTPLSALALGDLFLEAGLPAGVVNIVTTNDPAAVGDQFLSDRRVAKISFTGSTQVGKYLVERSAAQLKRVSMELGGHAPFIVFDDADLDLAVRHAVGSAYRNAGQTCICANRVYVQEAVVDEFAQRYAEAVSQLKVGPGMDPETQIGPLIDGEAIKKVEEHVEDAKAKGARVLVGGHRLEGPPYDGGFFFAPTVLTGVTDDMKIVHEETFGPVAPVLSFKTEDEVIAKANATNYGLAAYVFTRDLGRTIRVAEALEFGMVGVNETALALPQAPFGGIKESGFGREGGRHGLESFLEYKYMNVVFD